MKQCTKCKIVKPFDQFYKRRGASALRRARCIECFLSDEKSRRKSSNYQRDYTTRNSEWINDKRRVARQKPRVRANQIICQARRRARNAGVEFDIPNVMVECWLLAGKCQRSGIEFDLKPHPTLRVNPFAPSLDRIDSFKGYVIGNVQLVCDMYNRGKGQNDDNVFIDFCKKVAAFNVE